MHIRHFFFFILCVSAPILFFSFLLFSPRSLHDLHVVMTASQNWAQGKAVYHEFLVSSDPWGKYFAYPPLSLLFFYPFSKLPHGALVSLWDMLNALLLYSSVVLFSNMFLAENRGRARWALFSVMLFSYPVLSLFILGQTGMWVLFALALTLMFLRKQQYVLAPLPLVTLSFIKLYPAFFTLLFFKKHGKPLWSSFITALFAGIFLTVFLFPRETREFAARVLPKRAAIIPAPSNQSLDAFFSRTFTDTIHVPALFPFPRAARVLSVFSKLAMIYLLFAFFFRKIQPPQDALCFLILTYLIFAPLVWIHYYVLLVPVVFWFIKQWSHFSIGQKRLICISVLPAYTGLPCYAHEIFPFPLNNIFISMPLLGMLYGYGLYLRHVAKHAQIAKLS